jgi:hypothetical protein
VDTALLLHRTAGEAEEVHVTAVGVVAHLQHFQGSRRRVKKLKLVSCMNCIAGASCELPIGCCMGVREWYLLLHSRSSVWLLVEAMHAHLVVEDYRLYPCSVLLVSRLPSEPIGRRRELSSMGRCRPFRWQT